MKKSTPMTHESYPDTHHDTYSRTVFGFWMFLLSDFILFGALFATYAVLRHNTFGGPSANDIVHLPRALLETLIFLLSSFTIGMGGACAHRKDKKWTLAFFALTFALGCVFLGMELSGANQMLQEGHGWQKSAALSAFFTLVGTHSLHVIFGLIWIIVLCIPVCREGLTSTSIRRLTCLKMLWQFLNIVWIFIFSFVYLMGVK